MDPENDSKVLLEPGERVDRRNVIDEYRGLKVEEIRRRLNLKRNSFATLILNIDFDINISSIVRTHNAFSGREIFYLGRRKYNRRGTVGTYLYENITYLKDLEEAKEKIPKKYTWIGVDNRPGSVCLSDFNWPSDPLLVFGHERGGLDFLPELPYNCEHVVEIPQFGSTRSLNVGVAAGITMYDLFSKKKWIR